MAKNMTVTISAGKGGVGKTFISTSLAMHYSRMGHETCIIDLDGGHSVLRTLGWEGKVILTPNEVQPMAGYLSAAVVGNTPFTGIVEYKKTSGPGLEGYFAQFPDDLGLMALCDMVTAFFGIPTDIPTLQKFATLVKLLLKCKEDGFEHVIVDVEPTAGLELLLLNAQSMARSLFNLRNQGLVALTVIGTTWPDVRLFLKGDYIKQADRHGARIENTAEMLRSARYLVVTTPEASPVSQAFDVRKIIERFGGRVNGYVVNNTRGEPHESEQIARLVAGQLPIVNIERRSEMHFGDHNKLLTLGWVGQTVTYDLFGEK